MTELMQMVIDKLGVKVGERFKIKDDDGDLLYGNYYINEKGIMISAKQESRIGVLWQPLLIGEYQIVKPPFKPKEREIYNFVEEDGKVEDEEWWGVSEDYYRFNARNCFRTEKEITPEDKKRIVAEMKSKYESE